VVGGEEIVEIEMVLVAGSKLAVRVLDASNKNITATLKVLDSNGNRVDSDSGQRMFAAMENGTTPLGTFEPGSYTVIAEFEGSRQSQTVTIRSEDNQTLEFVF
jgi:hypothetical protein